MRKNIYILISMLLLASLVLGGCGSNVVATVNGEKITARELDEQVNALKDTLAQQGLNFEGEQAGDIEQMLRRDVLDQMIDRELVMAEIKRLDLMPTDKEVREEIENLKKQLGSEGEFKKYLAANGINEPKLEEYFKQQLAVTKLQEKISSEVPQPADAEIQAYYDAHKEQFSRPEQRQVSHILIGSGDYSGGKNRSEMEAKVLALQVVDKLKAGADFAELAKQYSDDPGSKDNGGQYPPFSKNSGFAEEFEDAAFSLQEGQYTAEPVKTMFGYHIIRLDKVIPAKNYSLAEVKDNITASLHQEAVAKKADELLQDLRDKAEIVNKLAEEPKTKKDGEQSTKK